MMSDIGENLSPLTTTTETTTTTTPNTWQPGDRVYRWWYSHADQADPQPLTVVRVNRKTVTVQTDSGSTFRLSPELIAGRWSE
jgi:predicted P-loop ATPase